MAKRATEKPNNNTEPQGVLLSCWGDSHCGSTVGLMFPKYYQFENNNFRPNPAQKAIWRVFSEYTDTIARLRQGRRLLVVLMGDLIDGVHHQTRQLHTLNLSEQRAMFLDCADYFLKTTGFSVDGGDRLYVLHGTDIRGSHGTPDDANDLGADLGAVPYLAPEPDDELGRGGWYAWRDLELDVLGQLVQLTHHAPVGKGTRAHLYGNAIRNWLRSHQTILDAARQKIPRYVIWAHKHTAHVETVRLENGRADGPLTTAVCVPALQGKSHWVRQALPLAPDTTIGGFWATFDPDGQTEARNEYAALNLERKPEKI
jgi:hypothetical protein